MASGILEIAVNIVVITIMKSTFSVINFYYVYSI